MSVREGVIIVSTGRVLLLWRQGGRTDLLGLPSIIMIDLLRCFSMGN